MAKKAKKTGAKRQYRCKKCQALGHNSRTCGRK